jgi:hypothetical protein
VFVIPDILANAGGVTASYFEWVQDRMGYFWTEDEVNQRLERIMIDSFDDVMQYAVAHGVNNRIAAYMLAIDRVAYTTKQRGIYAYGVLDLFGNNKPRGISTGLRSAAARLIRLAVPANSKCLSPIPFEFGNRPTLVSRPFVIDNIDIGNTTFR